MKYTMESENIKTIEFLSKNGNKYTVILENNLMSLVDKWNNVIENEIIFYNKLDNETIENFITNVVDGIKLDREQEYQLTKFIHNWYGENVE